LGSDVEHELVFRMKKFGLIIVFCVLFLSLSGCFQSQSNIVGHWVSHETVTGIGYLDVNSDGTIVYGGDIQKYFGCTFNGNWYRNTTLEQILGFQNTPVSMYQIQWNSVKCSDKDLEQKENAPENMQQLGVLKYMMYEPAGTGCPGIGCIQNETLDLQGIKFYRQ
jgi:hypothetical protein